MSRRLAAILICAAEAQWQGHGTHYGFAPDTGRASKHHSYEDHGSKPECPGLHDE